jgi:hypothetical protein
MGEIHCLASVMDKLALITGSKSRIFGYISIGESVPEVITTVWKRSRTGRIAIEASMQFKCKIDSWVLLSSGSKTSENPSEYVLTIVAKVASFTSPRKSEISANSRVFEREENLSAQNLEFFYTFLNYCDNLIPHWFSINKHS